MNRFFRAIAACAALVAVSACATDPARVAQTPLQKTYAVMQDYETAQALALTFAENEQVPDIVRDSLIRLEGAATPLFKATSKAVRQVLAQAEAVKAGTSTVEQLQLATMAMEQLAMELTAAMANLNRAVDEANASLKKTSGSLWEPSLVPLEEEPVVIVPRAAPLNVVLSET